MSLPTDRGAWLYIDELDHRTMNDYAFMLATIERASRGVADPDAANALAAIKARLTTRASSYRALRPPSGGGARRLDEALAQLGASLSTESNLTLTLFCDPITFPARRCWQLCLVISELVTNAMKHAFLEGAAGEVAIEVRTIGVDLQIIVSDNGRAASLARPGRGASIVDGLVEDLGGAVTRRHASAGSIIVVDCPLRDLAADEDPDQH